MVDRGDLIRVTRCFLGGEPLKRQKDTSLEQQDVLLRTYRTRTHTGRILIRQMREQRRYYDRRRWEIRGRGNAFRVGAQRERVSDVIPLRKNPTKEN